MTENLQNFQRNLLVTKLSWIYIMSEFKIGTKIKKNNNLLVQPVVNINEQVLEAWEVNGIFKGHRKHFSQKL